MKTALEIAHEAKLRPISEIATEAGILPEELEQSGLYRGKIRLSVLDRLASRPNGSSSSGRMSAAAAISAIGRSTASCAISSPLFTSPSVVSVPMPAGGYPGARGPHRAGGLVAVEAVRYPGLCVRRSSCRT